jgi:glutaredoxin 3
MMATTGTPQPATVRMYATGWCPYCVAARDLLRAKGVSVEEIDLTSDPSRRAEMESLSGRSSVPQIFIGDEHIGGYDDMAALDRSGRLDGLLGITERND